MDKKPKIEKKPTLKYEKPVLVDLAPERASGDNGCVGGSMDDNGFPP